MLLRRYKTDRIKVPEQSAEETAEASLEASAEEETTFEDVQEPVTDQVAEKQTVQPSDFEGMTVEQLKIYAEEHGINIGNATSANGIIKKIMTVIQK